MKKIIVCLTIMMLNMSCAQEKLELSDIKLGGNIDTIIKSDTSFVKREYYGLSPDMKLYYSESVLATYKGVPIKDFQFVTWKGKISEIEFRTKSFESQEKIFALLEKKYGKFSSSGKCSDDEFSNGCLYSYENDSLYISTALMFKNRFTIKGVHFRVEISDKKFEEEVHRLKVEESKKLEKEALERKEKYK